MPSLKRIVASPTFQRAVGTAAAWYLKLAWRTSSKTFSPTDIYDTVKMLSLIHI